MKPTKFPFLGYKMPRTHTSSSTHLSKSSPAPVVFQNPYSSVAPRPPIIEQPTLGQSIKQGFGFGAGSAIAHRFFGATPTVVSVPDKKVQLPCENERSAFESCLKSKTIDDFCGEQQMAYTQCIRLTNSGNQ
jgi:hypothetical protein